MFFMVYCMRHIRVILSSDCPRIACHGGICLLSLLPNNLRRKQGFHAPAHPVCEYFRLSGVNCRNFSYFRALKCCGKSGRAARPRQICCCHQATNLRNFQLLSITVPSFSPQTTRIMESFSLRPKAITGTLFSMHMVAAVASMALMPFFIMSI